MTYIIGQSERLIIRRTQKEDIKYVLKAEYEEENTQYVGQWAEEQHINSLLQDDIIHLIIEEKASARFLGYIIIAGITNPNHSIEFKRFVITDKGKGHGREITMKMLVFDLDNTLLNSEEMVSERNRQAIQKCSQRGMRIGYITLRSPRKMKTFLQGLPCDGIAHYNGALVYADDKLIMENVITYDNAINFINKVTEAAPGIGIAAYFEPFCYKDKKIRSYIEQEVLEYDLYSAPRHNFQRIRLFFQDDAIDFSQYISDEMQYQKSGNTAMITHKLADKGRAMEALTRYYGLKKEQTISFGDSMGDIPMLLASGTSVAMGNSELRVKDTADFITLSNDEDGVAEYLETYILAKEYEM